MMGKRASSIVRGQSITLDSGFAVPTSSAAVPSFALHDRGSVSVRPGSNALTLCLAPQPTWDADRVVVGRVVSGLRALEGVAKVVNVDPSSGHAPLPGFSVTVTECGLLPPSYSAPPLPQPRHREGAFAPSAASAVGAVAPASGRGAVPREGELRGGGLAKSVN